MRGLGITPKQRRYAWHVMNSDYNKKDAILASGYSEGIARNPSKVENSTGFKLAMAGIFAKSGNVAMTLLNELETRDLTKESTENIVKFFNVMTKAMERIAPKDSKHDTDLTSIIGYVVDDEPLTPSDSDDVIASQQGDLTEQA